jgi:hypothetical protein
MCPALANPVTAEAAAAAQNATAPRAAKSATTTGPLPAIRYATMEPCAEYLCQKAFALVKQADGTVACQVREMPRLRLSVSRGRSGVCCTCPVLLWYGHSSAAPAWRIVHCTHRMCEARSVPN